MGGSTGEVFLKNLAWVICILLLLATTSFSAGAAPPSGRKLYKWVDEQGVIHYGDHIPPEYASQEQHVVNSQGIETEHIEAQKTPEQMAAEEKKRFEAEQKASRDKNLLNTYVSVSEIERLRDQRLALLSDQIKVTGQFLEILNGRMKNLPIASHRFRPYSSHPHPPPTSHQFAQAPSRV